MYLLDDLLESRNIHHNLKIVVESWKSNSINRMAHVSIFNVLRPNR